MRLIVLGLQDQRVSSKLRTVPNSAATVIALNTLSRIQTRSTMLVLVPLVEAETAESPVRTGKIPKLRNVQLTQPKAALLTTDSAKMLRS